MHFSKPKRGLSISDAPNRTDEFEIMQNSTKRRHCTENHVNTVHHNNSESSNPGLRWGRTLHTAAVDCMHIDV
jgi:hypothetical protein